MSETNYGALSPVGLGAAFGLLWGLLLFGMAIIVHFAGGYGQGFVAGVGSLYIGYKASFLGGLIGALWGLVDAFVMGAVLAWVYNIFM